MMNESTSWIAIFILVIITGIIALLLELLLPSGPERILSDGYRLLSIFLGVLAGNDIRRDLWNIYSNITHYNDEFQRYHIAAMEQTGSSVTPEFQDEITNLRELISSLIAKFFEAHSLKL